MTIDSDSSKFARALSAAIFWPLGVFFAAILLLVTVVLALLSEITSSTHSYQVLSDVHVCENMLIAGQDDVRGYLLTGDKAYSDSYRLHRDHAVAELARLKQLVSDDPEQEHNLQDILDAKEAWVQHAEIMIAQHTAQAPVNPDWVKLGSTIEDQIRQGFDRFVSTEIKIRDARLQNVRRMKTLLAGAGAVLAGLLVFTIVYQVRRQMLELATGYRSVLGSIEQRQAALTRSERDLEAQKEWLRVTLTSIGDGVIVTDPEGRVLLMNHEAERLTGWLLTDALHHPLAEVFHIISEETRALVENPVAKVLVDKKTVGLANHTVLISRTAEERPIEDSAAPIVSAAGETLGVVLVFHDASTSRLTQKSLQAHSSELEKIVAERTLTLQQTVADLQAFSYTVSHDLRSPLRAMQGFSEAVIEDYADKLDERGRHYLQRIQAAAARLDRLIVDLLSYTRMSRDEAPLEPLDLDRIVRDIIEADTHLKPPATEVRIEGTLPRVVGRDSALNQVFTNLLGNAVKFVREGETPQIRIWSEDHGPRVRVWIEDKGLGIPESEREKIFDMFVQLNDATGYGGTGVGLAIVKKAMQIMRGTVGVESMEGSGSRFWLELGKA